MLKKLFTGSSGSQIDRSSSIPDLIEAGILVHKGSSSLASVGLFASKVSGTLRHTASQTFRTATLESKANECNPDESFDPFSPTRLRKSKSLPFQVGGKPSFFKLGRKRSVQFLLPSEDNFYENKLEDSADLNVKPTNPTPGSKVVETQSESENSGSSIYSNGSNPNSYSMTFRSLEHYRSYESQAQKQFSEKLEGKLDEPQVFKSNSPDSRNENGKNDITESVILSEENFAKHPTEFEKINSQYPERDLSEIEHILRNLSVDHNYNVDYKLLELGEVSKTVIALLALFKELLEKNEATVRTLKERVGGERSKYLQLETTLDEMKQHLEKVQFTSEKLVQEREVTENLVQEKEGTKINIKEYIEKINYKLEDLIAKEAWLQEELSKSKAKQRTTESELKIVIRSIKLGLESAIEENATTLHHKRKLEKELEDLKNLTKEKEILDKNQFLTFENGRLKLGLDELENKSRLLEEELKVTKSEFARAIELKEAHSQHDFASNSYPKLQNNSLDESQRNDENVEFDTYVSVKTNKEVESQIGNNFATGLNKTIKKKNYEIGKLTQELKDNQTRLKCLEEISKAKESALTNTNNLLKETLLGALDDKGILMKEQRVLRELYSESTNYLQSVRTQLVLAKQAEENTNKLVQKLAQSNGILWDASKLIMKNLLDSLATVLKDETNEYYERLYHLLQRKNIFTTADLLLIDKITKSLGKTVREVISTFENNEEFLIKEIESNAFRSQKF